MASVSAKNIDGIKPVGTPAEVFFNLLDAILERLQPDRVEELGVPDDELHREILLPLLPAMFGDKAIRENWRQQAASGFFARLNAYMNGDAKRPEWNAADFEIHVTASYQASADAKALADTLLSEESLRDLTAELMNRVMPFAWESLPMAKPAMKTAEVETAPIEEPATADVQELETPEVPEVFVEARLTKVPVNVHHSRPQLPDFRTNPIRGAASAMQFGFRNWIGRNPLEVTPLERKMRYSSEWPG